MIILFNLNSSSNKLSGSSRSVVSSESEIQFMVIYYLILKDNIATKRPDLARVGRSIVRHYT